MRATTHQRSTNVFHTSIRKTGNDWINSFSQNPHPNLSKPTSQFIKISLSAKRGQAGQLMGQMVLQVTDRW